MGAWAGPSLGHGQPPVVGEGLLDLGAGVHNEGAVLDHGLADRAALKQQELGRGAAVDEGGGALGTQAHERLVGDLATADGEGVAAEEVQGAVAADGGGGEGPGGAGGHLDGPDRDVAGGLGGP